MSQSRTAGLYDRLIAKASRKTSDNGEARHEPAGEAKGAFDKFTFSELQSRPIPKLNPPVVA